MAGLGQDVDAGATMAHGDVVMVAERAVGKLIDDLRGKIGVTPGELQKSINEIKTENEAAVED